MAVPVGVDLAEPYVELSYVDAVHERQRRPLLDCATARFEDVTAVRPFRWSRSERHFSGWYWAVTTGRHVGSSCENRLATQQVHTGRTHAEALVI
ncbi:hypothetical protein [Streptomyces sp. NPDC048710]|uniref:hypothetical protein n=1 Tax=Streptomyces sp. NPDC048710 TaxID=3365586 RepID=UPI00371388D9